MVSTRRALLSGLAAAFLVTSSTLAQGADVCASAQPIGGTGVFVFDVTTATTDGAADPLCAFSSQSQINNDVWFSWVPTSSGGFTISTCGQTTIDSKIALYAGSCGGAILACNDDACASLQSTFDVIVTSGNTYILRVGVYPNAVLGSGTISISPVGQLAVLDTQVNPGNAHTYYLLAAGVWTAAEATAIALGGHLATVNDAAENAWIRTTWQNFQATPHDLWIGFNDAAVEGTFVWADGSPVTYTNWDGGEPNNALTGEDYTNIRRDSATGNWNDLGNAPSGYFNAVYGVVEIGSTASTAFCFGDGADTACPCTNPGLAGRGCDNTFATGGASISSTGTASISNDTLVLNAANLGAFQFGLYFEGSATANPTAPFGITFGNGVRCVNFTGANRLEIRQADAGGLSNTTVALSIPGFAIAGTTYYYQLWYRDGVPPTMVGPVMGGCVTAGFNFSHALSLTWGL